MVVDAARGSAFKSSSVSKLGAPGEPPKSHGEEFSFTGAHWLHVLPVAIPLFPLLRSHQDY